MKIDKFEDIIITNNIAEGFGRKGDKELSRYLKISKGSCLETRSMLYSALDLGYFNQEQFDKAHDLTVRIEQTLVKFIKSIKTTNVGRATIGTSDDWDERRLGRATIGTSDDWDERRLGRATINNL